MALAVVAGCAQSAQPVCPEGMDEFVNYQLFMGRSTSDGMMVTDDEWSEFLADIVTPRFPDGLTVVDAAGQWRSSDGVVQRERSKVLMILAPPGDEGMNLIDEVSDEYKSRFDQESVLKVVGDACVSF